MSLRSDLKDLGYNQEEAYFHKKEKELIDKLHDELVQTGQTPEEKPIPLPQGKANFKAPQAFTSSKKAA